MIEYRNSWAFKIGVSDPSSTTYKRLFPSMLLASGLLTDAMFAGFVISRHFRTLTTSSIGLDWIVGAESLRVALFPLFLGGLLMYKKIFLDRVSPNSFRIFAGFSSSGDL
jgi:hypothetical protein